MTDPPIESWRRGDYTITTDRARIDVDVVHAYLTRSYWAENIPRETVARAIDGALNLGIYHHAPADVAQPPFAESPRRPAVGSAADRQVGGARIIIDFATFAYIADVFVLEEHRGKALGIWLMDCVAAHPSLQGLRRWMLGTADAHRLYQKTGFVPVAAPDRWMERAFPDLYKK